MGMEVCTTLGMLTSEQAVALKNAGLTAYNHNLDTSREYYGKVCCSSLASSMHTLTRLPSVRW
jgi:biotin synthase